MGNLPALDGVRAVAVLLVMLFHAWNQQAGLLSAEDWPYHYPIYYTRTGVNLFFVLSGFLLFMPYARWIFALQSAPSAYYFYKRRILRVGPGYWICLGLLVATGPLTAASLGDGVLHVTFLFNARPSSIESINSVFWTMAVEVQFYACLPLIAWFTWRAARRIGPLMATLIVEAAMVAISVLAGAAGHIVDPDLSRPIWTALVGIRSLPFYLAVFGFGIGCSVAYVYLTQVRKTSPAEARWRPAVATAGFVAAMTLGVGLAVAATRISHVPGTNLVFGAAYAAMLLGILLGFPIVRRLFEQRVLRFIGLISYSLYLWHLVVVDHVASLFTHVTPSVERVALVFGLELLVALPLGYVSYVLSERPFIAARKRAQGARPVPGVTDRDEPGLPTTHVRPRRAAG